MFLVGDLIKINENLIKRPINLYNFHETMDYYYPIGFFEQNSTGVVLEFKNENKISYMKIICDDSQIGWVRSVYLEKI